MIGRALVASLAALVSPALHADFQLQLNNTIRAEHYDNGGNSAIATFPNAGGQFYDDLAINFSQSSGKYQHWKGQAQLLFNHSEYRNQRFGTEVQRWNLTREDGRAAAPFRLQFGDWFGFLSLRSLQRSLKGVHLELQPHGTPFGLKGAKQSWVILLGTSDPSWRDYKYSDDRTLATSYLLDSPQIGRWNINYVYSTDDRFLQPGQEGRAQRVMSLATNQQWSWKSQQVTFDAEYGYFNGDHFGSSNVSDSGLMAHLQGRFSSRPLNWRLRYERYGQNYRPDGASVSANRRSLELHSDYRFKSGIALRARVQRFEDQFQSANPVNTRTAGLNLSGRLPWAITASLDGFVQLVQNQSLSNNRRSQSFSFSLNRPLWNKVTASLNGSFQFNRDLVRRDSPSVNRQFGFNLNIPMIVWGWSGNIAPGVSFRHGTRSGGAFNDDISPRLAVNLSRNRHGISLATNVNQQNRNNGADAQTRSVNASYRWSGDRNSVGLEVSWQERSPEGAEDNSGTKVSVFWNHRFDSQQLQAARATEQQQRQAAEIDTRQPLKLLDLPPGSNPYDAATRLMAYGAVPSLNIARHTVYEYPLLPQIDQRQRVVLGHRAGVMQFSALIVDLDSVGNLDSLEQTFARVREALIQRYGQPGDFFELGVFDPNTLRQQIRDNQFIRNFEWTLPQGTLRVGIPRRLDDQVRIEVQYRQRFNSPRDTLWAIDEVQ